MRERGRNSKAIKLVPLMASVVCAFALAANAAPASAALNVTWMAGYAAPGTPAKYDKVGVIKIGPHKAKNVLVLEPGTSAAAAYFVPLAKWIVATVPGWQVWAVQRRESLLQDESVLNEFKAGRVTAQAAFNYYLGYLTNSSITNHFQPVADSSVPYARQWGLQVAVQDLHDVIRAAKKLGGQVVLGGHSLGGSVVTAYATWDFDGKPGADELDGLVYDDGGSLGAPTTAAQATQALGTLATTTPWLAFSGVPAPYLGLFSSLGSTAALVDPNQLAVALSFTLLPAALKPPVPVTNLALFGYDTDTKTSKLSFAAQAHLGQLNTSVSPAGWNSAEAITPIDRFASMLSGTGVNNADGSEWYFPQRLTIDTGAIDEGNANPAQSILDVQATEGHHLPKRLRIYAFGAYGGQAILAAATTLAAQSGIPASHLTLINRQGTYAHNDPAAAYPNNAFFNGLVPFLEKISR